MGSSISNFHLSFFILEHVAEQMDEDYNRSLWDPTGCLICIGMCQYRNKRLLSCIIYRWIIYMLASWVLTFLHVIWTWVISSLSPSCREGACAFWAGQKGWNGGQVWQVLWVFVHDCLHPVLVKDVSSSVKLSSLYIFFSWLTWISFSFHICWLTMRVNL